MRAVIQGVFVINDEGVNFLCVSIGFGRRWGPIALFGTLLQLEDRIVCAVCLSVGCCCFSAVRTNQLQNRAAMAHCS